MKTNCRYSMFIMAFKKLNSSQSSVLYNMAWSECIKINLLCNTALRVLLSTSAHAISTSPYRCGFPSKTLLHCLGVTSYEICCFPQRVSFGKPHCHLRSLFPRPPPPPTKKKKDTKSPKNMENTLLFHIWKTWRTWCHRGGRTATPRAIGSILTQSLISLATLGPPSNVSVVLIHPVPAFITVLPVLLSFDDFSVAPAEESHLPE